MHISAKNIQKTFLKFVGQQKQTPPIFSAIKINGERLYKKARRGEKNIQPKEREIIIENLNILNINLPFIKFEIKCSKGTYIRSLANDIGKQFKCGAYLYNLTRTKIGDYELKKSLDINDINRAFIR